MPAPERENPEVGDERVHPELRPALAKLPRLDISKRLMRFVGRVGPRLRRGSLPAGVTVRRISEGAVRLRIASPDTVTSQAALLWIHGGGLVIGTASQDDALCASTALRLGITVVAVEYRLAPESPFPAALNDAMAAWDWVQDNAAELGIDPSRVAVGGESAGGGIAASLVHRLHDERPAAQPVAQWLFAPMLDDRTASRTSLDDIDHPVWNNRDNRFGWSAYLGQDPGLSAAPAYSVAARREDLRGLPPVWLCCGDVELFHDEIVAYAERLREADVEVVLETIEGGAHGFENWAWSTRVAQDRSDGAQRWLADVTDSQLRETPPTP